MNQKCVQNWRKKSDLFKMWNERKRERMKSLPVIDHLQLKQGLCHVD